MALPGEDHQAGSPVTAAPAPPTSSSSAAASSGRRAAWHLRQDGFTGRIVVVERDPTYARASSFLAMGGIRQQFCTPVTVQMVQYSVRLWKEFDERMRTPAHTPRAWFRQRGYLFLADDATSAALIGAYRRAEPRAGAGAAAARASTRSRRWCPTWRSTTSAGVCSVPRTATPTRARCCSACAPPRLTRRCRLRARRGGRRGGRAGGRVAASARPVPAIDAPVVVNAAGPLARSRRRAGRAATCRSSRCARCSSAHAAAPLADAVSDGDRSGRRALAARRSDGARRSRSHHRRLHQLGRADRRELRRAMTRAGSTSSFRRWCAVLPAFAEVVGRRRMGRTLRDDARSQPGARRASGARRPASSPMASAATG